MFIEKKDLAAATFIICFVVVISVFGATSILLNHIEDGNFITGNAVKEIIEEKKLPVKEVFEKAVKPSYSIEIIEINDSLGLCNISKSDKGAIGKCSKPEDRLTIQFLVNNSGSRRISDLREEFYCYDSDPSGVWSFFGPASDGAIYDQIINQDPYVAILEPGNSFVYKLITKKTDIKQDKLNCDIRFFSKTMPLQLRKSLFLNFTQEVISDSSGDKTYLNKILSSIDRSTFRRLDYD